MTILGLTIVIAVVIVRVSTGASSTAKEGLPSVKLGEHLVTTLACNGCHTPFKLGPNGTSLADAAWG